MVVKAAFSHPLLTTGRPERSTSFGLIREANPGDWQRNIVTESMAGLTAFGAVYACLTLIANDIGKLRPVLMAKGGPVKAPADITSPHWRALRKPNAYQTRNQFYRSWLLSKLMHGNTYVLKVREAARGMVMSLHVLDPRRVTPMVTPEGDVYYSLAGDDLAKIPAGMLVPASEIIHDRCCTLWHPLVGVPPLYAAALSATQGRKIQANSSLFFENMSRPSGILKGPGIIPPEEKASLKEQWEANYSGLNIGRLAVLGGGLTYEAMTIPAEQAQLIDQLKWTALDICGPFHVPPYKIGVGPMPTNNNVEALNQQYYTDTLQTHIEDIEGLLDEGLEVPSDKCVEFDIDAGLLRMDSGAQMDMLATGVEKCILVPNEARARLNRPPKTGGDELYLQQQNYSLSALAKRDSSDDPFGKAKPPAAAPAAPAPADPDPEEGADRADAAKHLADVLARSHEAFADQAQQWIADALTKAAAENAAAMDQVVKALAGAETRAAEALASAATATEALGALKQERDAAVQAADLATLAAAIASGLDE